MTTDTDTLVALLKDAMPAMQDLRRISAEDWGVVMPHDGAFVFVGREHDAPRLIVLEGGIGAAADARQDAIERLCILAPGLAQETIANRARIEALEAEVARCHARLEITHVGQMKGDGTADLIRVEVPMAERATMPDGIDARDAAIGLLDEDIARLPASLVAEVTESEALRTQLTEARAGEDELATILSDIRAFFDCPEQDADAAADELEDRIDAALASHDKRKEGRNA